MTGIATLHLGARFHLHSFRKSNFSRRKWTKSASIRAKTTKIAQNEAKLSRIMLKTSENMQIGRKARKPIRNFEKCDPESLMYCLRQSVFPISFIRPISMENSPLVFKRSGTRGEFSLIHRFSAQIGAKQGGNFP